MPNGAEASAGGPRPAKSTSAKRPLLVAIGTSALLGSVSLIYPAGRDQGFFACIADMVRHGRVMYRDISNGIYPMTILLNLVAQVSLGHNMAAIRVLDLLWTMGTAVLLFAFARRVFRRLWLASAIAMMYSFLYFLGDFWNTAQVDGFLNLPVATAFCAAAFAADGHSGVVRGRLWWFLSGLMVAVALFFKPTVGLMLPAIALLALFGRRSRASVDWSALAMVLAGALVGALVFMALITTSGALRDFIELQFRGTLHYVRLGSARAGLPTYLADMVGNYVLQPNLGIGAFLAGVGLVLSVVIHTRAGRRARDSDRRAIRWSWVWLACGFASLAVQGKFFQYHYLPLLPGMAVFAVLALDAALTPVWPHVPKQSGRALLVIGVGILLVLCTAYPLRLRDAAQVATGQMPLRDYWMSDHGMGDFRLSEQMVVSDWVRAHTRPNDRIVVWGSDPLIYFLTERGTISRFIANQSLTVDWSWPELRDEFQDAFRNTPPELFLVEHDDAVPWATGSSLDSYEVLKERFGVLGESIADQYALETRIGHFDILRRASKEGVYPPAPIAGVPAIEDLDEALGFVRRLPRTDARAILWPGSLPSASFPAWRGLPADRFVGYWALNRALWMEDKTIRDYLPALSIWVRNDPRPFAQLEPFRYQNDSEHFVSGEFRFTLLHTCKNGRVLIYALDEVTGEERVK
jgi:hypothetical protein